MNLSAFTSLASAAPRFILLSMRTPFRTKLMVALVAAGLVSACATVNARTTPTASTNLVRRFVPDYEHVPTPPMDVDGAVLTAWEALRRGDLTTSRTSLDAAGLTTAGALTTEGFWQLAQGAAPSARTRFQQAIAIDAGYASALYGLGFVSEAEGNRVSGIDWYQQAVAADITLSPAAVRLQVLQLEQAQAFIAQGEQAASIGDDAAALSSYEAALDLAPDVLEPYLSIAAIQGRAGDTAAQIRTLRSARDRLGEQRIVLEPLGKALQAQGDYAAAYDAFQSLEDVAPGDAGVVAMVAESRELYFTTSLPQPYRELETKAQITRDDLAALVAIRLPNLGAEVEELRTGVIIVDIDDSWAGDYIREVVEWGVMQVFQNHAFGPELVVKRQYFAEVAYRVLELLDEVDGAPRARLSDVSTEHYFYDEIRVVVGQGVLELGPRDSFGLLAPVSGEEAIAAVQRLVRLARSEGDR